MFVFLLMMAEKGTEPCSCPPHFSFLSRFLTKDFSIDCNSRGYSRVRGTSWAFLFGYGIGIPVAFNVLGQFLHNANESVEMNTFAFLMAGFKKCVGLNKLHIPSGVIFVDDFGCFICGCPEPRGTPRSSPPPSPSAPSEPHDMVPSRLSQFVSFLILSGTPNCWPCAPLVLSLFVHWMKVT